MRSVSRGAALFRANLRGHPLRKKRWNFWNWIGPDCVLSVTLADIDFASFCAFTLLDLRDGARFEGGSYGRPGDAILGLASLADVGNEGGEQRTPLHVRRGDGQLGGEAATAAVQFNTTPRISAEAARQAALQTVAKAHQAPVESLQASEPALRIYNPALLDSFAPLDNQLTYLVEVTSPQRPDIRHLVLVEAMRGTIALEFNQVHTAMNRIVNDNNNTVSTTLPGLTPPVRT